MPSMSQHSLLTWTLGRASIIWRIWPAVVLHTAFAAVVVTLTMRGLVNLEIPPVMLTVLGVVIGFVISYRASSGYEKYWMGRSCWSEVIRNILTMGRLIWFHVPPRLTPRTTAEAGSGQSRPSVDEMRKVMAEKMIALDLLEGFAVALKHRLRGEPGIFYRDLYHLVKPFYGHHHLNRNHTSTTNAIQRLHSAHEHHVASAPETVSASIEAPLPISSSLHATSEDPVIPPINTYGTFDPSHLYVHPHTSSLNLSASSSDDHLPLLTSDQLQRRTPLLSKVSGDLIPFSGALDAIFSFFSTRKEHPFLECDQETNPHSHPHGSCQGPPYPRLHTKHRPLAATTGENIPVEIIWHLSNWFSVLEDRGTVPGTSLGQMISTLSAFEDNLATLERILTSPLPFVYSVHIRTVWIYLFFLPFQIVGQFGWFTIPGVAIAAFLYLGFLAAGEEIEQPFGYDENDLDLDFFYHEIIHKDMEHLKTVPCANAFLEPDHQHQSDIHHQSATLVDLVDGHNEENPSTIRFTVT